MLHGHGHGHVYVEGAPFTDTIILCGAIEEFEEITRLFPDKNATNFVVNLKGHGSIAVTDKWENLRDIDFQPRDRYDDEIRPDLFKQYAAGNIAGKHGQKGDYGLLRSAVI